MAPIFSQHLCLMVSLLEETEFWLKVRVNFSIVTKSVISSDTVISDYNDTLCDNRKMDPNNCYVLFQ